MSAFFSLLSVICSLYTLVIFIRVILTWFRGGGGYGQAETLLGRITDPYLNWFRRFRFLRIGAIDLSPIAALGFLSLLNRAFAMMARYGTLRLGLLLIVALQICWSAVQFFLGFCAVVLILRLIAYLTNRNTFANFWRVIDTISQPIVFRINRILFGGRIVHYLTGLLVSIIALVLCSALGSIAVFFLSRFFERLPF